MRECSRERYRKREGEARELERTGSDEENCTFCFVIRIHKHTTARYITHEFLKSSQSAIDLKAFLIHEPLLRIPAATQKQTDRVSTAM